MYDCMAGQHLVLYGDLVTLRASGPFCVAGAANSDWACRGLQIFWQAQYLVSTGVAHVVLSKATTFLRGRRSLWQARAAFGAL